MMRRVAKELALIVGLTGLLFIIGVGIFNLPLIFDHPTARAATLPATVSNNVLPNPTLIVPALAVQAPIVFSATDRDSDVLKDLLKGVSHSPSSALPGGVGNVFIVGHSSNYPWEHGDYNHVFSYLNKLKIGDVAYLDYRGKRYEYVMTGSRTVWPNDYSVMAQNGGYHLSLMTCYPTNTVFKRLVVSFDLKQTYE